MDNILGHWPHSWAASDNLCLDGSARHRGRRTFELEALVIRNKVRIMCSKCRMGGSRTRISGWSKSRDHGGRRKSCLFNIREIVPWLGLMVSWSGKRVNTSLFCAHCDSKLTSQSGVVGSPCEARLWSCRRYSTCKSRLLLGP